MKDNAYKQAGVDIEAGDALVERIRPHVKKTRRAGMVGDLGGFGAFFDVKAAGFRDPLIVSSTDGVGTKLKIAIETGQHDTVGIDLVAMCVNDIVVQGAEPLFFLDYFATGKLDNDVAERVIAGIAAGCAEAGCALVGGETAEMPGMYAAGDYDLAGFAVGAVERGRVITGERVVEGDVVLGLASSGVHSNGYSLVRKIAAAQKGGYAAPAPFAPGKLLGQALMTPTRIYVRPLLAALAVQDKAGAPAIRGMAHITGGGLTGNIPRVLPEGLGVILDAAKWPLPAVFGWLRQQGGISAADMALTFNCGIGMVVICAPEATAELSARLRADGETVHEIGIVAPAASVDEAVIIHNADSAWR